MERRASAGKPSRRREPAWKGKPAPPWKSNRELRNALRDLLGGRGDALGDQAGAQEPWGICWEALGTHWGINQEPGNALRNLLGGRGNGLGDQPGARERLGGPAGKPWGRLGGSTGSPGTPWGTAWEAVRRLGGPTGGLGTPRGTCWKALGTPWRTFLENLGQTLEEPR